MLQIQKHAKHKSRAKMEERVTMAKMGNTPAFVQLITLEKTVMVQVCK